VTAGARVVIVRDAAEHTIDVGAGAITIGRDADQVVRLADDDVAARHAVLHLDGSWWVEAIGGPLAVDGRAIARGGRADVRRGARIAVGGWTLAVEEPPPDSVAAGPMRTASIARELVRELIGGELQGGPTLAIDGGPGAGRTIALPPPPSRVVIGRGEEADVVILDADLSRRHAAFERDADGVRVSDLGSKNGTRIGGEAVPDDPGRPLRAGDIVVAGRTRLRLQDPAEEYLRALDRRTATPPAATPPTRELAAAPASTVPAPRGSLAPVVVAASIAIAALVALILLLV